LKYYISTGILFPKWNFEGNTYRLVIGSSCSTRTFIL